MKLGKIYGKLKKYSKAIESFKEAIRSNPNSSEAHYYLGLAYLRNGNSIFAERNAVKQYRKLLSLDKEVALRFKKELPENALDSSKIKFLKNVAKSDSDNILYQIKIAEQYIKETKWDDAENMLTVLNSKFPKSQKVLDLLSTVYIHKLQIQDAFSTLKKSVAIGSEEWIPSHLKDIKKEQNQHILQMKAKAKILHCNLLSWMLITERASKLNLPKIRDKAESNFDANSKNLCKLIFALSNKLYSQQRLNEALQCLIENANILKSQEEYSFMQGKIYFRMGKFEEAKSLLSNPHPKFQHSKYWLLGQIESKLGNIESSIQSFKKAISLNTSDFDSVEKDSVNNLAIALSLSGMPDKAVKLINDHSKNIGSNGRILLFDAFVRMKKTNQAQQVFSSFEKIPNLPEAYFNYLSPESLESLGKLFTKSGKHTVAKKFLLIAEQQGHNSSEINKNLAMIASKAQNSEEAVSCYLKLVKENATVKEPSNPKGKYYLAVAYSIASKNNEAISLFEKCLNDCQQILPTNEAATNCLIKASDNLGNSKLSEKLISHWKRSFSAISRLPKRDFHILQARYFSSKKQEKDAIKAFVAAITASKDALNVQLKSPQVIHLGRAFSLCGQHKNAFKLLAKEAKKGANLNLHYAAAIEACRLNDSSKVKSIVTSLKKKYPKLAHKLILLLDQTQPDEFLPIPKPEYQETTNKTTRLRDEITELTGTINNGIEKVTEFSTGKNWQKTKDEFNSYFINPMKQTYENIKKLRNKN
jgi:tetratricopeptide (TPR) repeat protein